jgi:hypothetical protein
VRTESERVLDPHDDLLPGAPGEEAIQPIHHAGVSASDGAHGDEFSFDELHAVVFGEDAGLGHAVVFLHGEQASLDLNAHRFPPRAIPGFHPR